MLVCFLILFFPLKGFFKDVPFPCNYFKFLVFVFAFSHCSGVGPVSRIRVRIRLRLGMYLRLFEGYRLIFQA